MRLLERVAALARRLGIRVFVVRYRVAYSRCDGLTVEIFRFENASSVRGPYLLRNEPPPLTNFVYNQNPTCPFLRSNRSDNAVKDSAFGFGDPPDDIERLVLAKEMRVMSYSGPIAVHDQ